jgi:putative salt-induced outer membrane protein YdiY
MKNVWFFGVMVCLSGSVVVGDEVLFKSGDRLTGTVKAIDAGKMVFDSAVAGPLTLKMTDIKTFSTESPVEIVQTNGTVSVQKVVAGAEGQVAVLKDAQPPQTMALGEIAQVNPPKPKWTGALVAGAVLARGNTESSTASVGVEATRRYENHRIYLGGGYYFASQRDNNTGDNSTISDNWFLKGKYDYFFTQRFFGYANMKYEKDRIASLDMRLTPGTGLGYQWLESKELNFFTEAGLTYVHEVYTDPDDTRDYMAARAAYHFDFALNTYVKGFHNFEIIPNVDDYEAFLVNTDVGIRAELTARIFLEAKAQMAYNSEPSPDREKKDLRYMLGVGWSF